MRTLLTVAVTTLVYFLAVELEAVLLFFCGKLNDPNWRSIESILLLLLVFLVIWFTPLRSHFPIRSTWSWTLLLPLSFLPVYLWFFSLERATSIQPLEAFILWKVSTSILEELGLRGFAYLSFEKKRNPKLTTFLSSLAPCALSLPLLINNQDRDLKTFSIIVIYTFTTNLCYGISRTVTNSLAWTTIIAIVTNISFLFVTPTPGFAQVSYIVTGFDLSLGLIVLFFHPAMRLQSAGGGDLRLGT